MYLVPNDEHKLCAMDDETDESLGVLCEEVSVTEERVDLLTNDFVPQIIIWQDGEEVELSMSMDELYSNPFPILHKKGLHMLDTPENRDALKAYLTRTDEEARKVYEHRKLGFHTLKNGKTVFLANEVIGDCKKVSHYFKPEVTARKGTLETWLDIVNKEVIGHPHMELALAIGASAPVAHLLQAAKIIVEIPIFNLAGESSTGKTSSVRLMASITGSAEEGSGLIKDFNTSSRAVLAMLQDRGIIHLIDESTTMGMKDPSDMLYKLSKGMDKLTCNPDGSLKERQMFTGCVVITGELDMLKLSAANLGLYARVIILTFPWTDDADHARRITQGFRTNYGTAIIPYAKRLLTLQKHPNLLKAGFNQELREFRDKIGNVSGVEERLLNAYATVTLSATLFSKALGLDVDIPGMRDLLAEAHRKAPHKGDIAQELYDTIFDEVALHGQHFPTTSGKKRHLIAPDSLWGEQTTLQGKEVLWIAGNKFQEFARNHGFDNPTPYLQELHKQGLVKKYSDGFTTKHNLGGNQVRCYCFYKS